MKITSTLLNDMPWKKSHLLIREIAIADEEKEQEEESFHHPHLFHHALDQGFAVQT